MAEQLNGSPFDPAKGHPRALAKNHYANRGGFLARLVLKRQIKLNLRDRTYFIARLIQVSTLSHMPPCPHAPHSALSFYTCRWTSHPSKVSQHHCC